MIIDEKTIKGTLLKGERVTQECKKAQSNVPVDAWKTYSAFANTYGELILLGVHEDLNKKDISKRFTITGVDDAVIISKDFQRIQNMFRMIGFGENLGSGFPLILNAWHWLKPELIEQRELIQVLILSIETKEEDALANAPVNAPVKLNKTQSAIVNAILNDNSATYDNLSTIVGVDRSTITRNIASLKKKGVIRRRIVGTGN